jgi:adenosine deaminase
MRPAARVARAARGDWFARVAKVELHLHLEGAIPLAALFTLIRNVGGDPSVPTLAALRRRFRYRDFQHFIDTWVWKNSFLRTYEDFTFIAEAVARSLVAQRVRYAELFYSPPDFRRHGLTTQRLTEAIRAGLARVPELQANLIADLVRDFGPARAARTLREVAEVRDFGVVGVGLGGSEHRFPPQPFAPVFEQARELGLRTTAHAGEALGPGSIWSALRDLRVDRIGHGTRAGEDPALLTYLATRRIPLEMCPLSNVRTGVVARLADHPLRAYLDQGLLVTVNTDDPAMFGTTLAGELRGAATDLGLSRDRIRQVLLNGIDASWLPVERKRALKGEFLAEETMRSRGHTH